MVPVSPNAVAEFPNVVHIVVPASPNVVAEFPKGIPIVVSVSPNVVAEFHNVVLNVVSQSPNVVAEGPHCGACPMRWLNFPIWSPLRVVWFSQCGG